MMLECTADDFVAFAYFRFTPCVSHKIDGFRAVAREDYFAFGRGVDKFCGCFAGVFISLRGLFGKSVKSAMNIRVVVFVEIF